MEIIKSSLGGIITCPECGCQFKFTRADLEPPHKLVTLKTEPERLHKYIDSIPILIVCPECRLALKPNGEPITKDEVDKRSEYLKSGYYRKNYCNDRTGKSD